jgi:putative spermidine/putrescine transport system permease protein
MPALGFALVVYLVPLAIYLVNALHAFRDGRIVPIWTLETAWRFVTDPFSYRVIGASLRLSVTVTALAVGIGYPLAYALHTRVVTPWGRVLASLFLFSPLVVSVVVRTYGWLILLADQGLVNTVLRKMGIVQAPLALLFNLTGVVISLTHILLPFAVFPIYSVLGRIDWSLREAACDLGADWRQTFLRITLPLSMPGVVSASLICFTLALSAFVTPQLLGGGRVQVLPLAVYDSTVEINWPAGAVAATALLALSMAAVWTLNRALRRLPSL